MLLARRYCYNQKHCKCHSLPMQILNTADWHLGQHSMSKPRQAEHQAFIDWLIQQLRNHAVDAAIIVGRIFDAVALSSDDFKREFERVD